MRFRVISCAVMDRELEMCASRSANEIEMFFLEQGLHNTPDKLREETQRAIEEADGDGFDAIILGYGLCSRGALQG